MTGFELGSSGIGSDRTDDCATQLPMTYVTDGLMTWRDVWRVTLNGKKLELILKRTKTRAQNQKLPLIKQNSSVTRLGYFWKFLARDFVQKYPNY